MSVRELKRIEVLGRVKAGVLKVKDAAVLLGKDEGQAALDATVSGDEAIAVEFLLGHAEVGAAMGDQLVGLFESALVEQELDALAGGHLAFFVLPIAALGAATVCGKVVAPL